MSWSAYAAGLEVVARWLCADRKRELVVSRTEHGDSSNALGPSFDVAVLRAAQVFVPDLPELPGIAALEAGAS